MRFEASKTGECLLARFEESRIKTERVGVASALPSRSGTDGKHHQASLAALDGMNHRENAAERDGQRPGDTPVPLMMGWVGQAGRVGRVGEGQQADDSKVTTIASVGRRRCLRRDEA